MRRLKFLIIPCSLILLYFSEIMSRKFHFFLDFSTIILPLADINGFEEYYKALIEFKLYDLQPIRDFLTYGSIRLFQGFQFNSFLLLGILLISSSLIVIYKIALLKTKNIYLSLTILILLFFHPSFHHSFLVLTQTKHNSAFFFSLLTLYFWLKSIEQNNNISFDLKTLLFFSCSLLCHPIFILFSLYCTLYDISLKKLGLKRSIQRNHKALFISLFWGLATIIYYDYLHKNTLSSNLNASLSIISVDDLLQVGRSFAQAFFPLTTGPVFNAGNPINFYGIFGLFLFLYLGFKVFKNFKNDFFYLALLSFLIQSSYLFKLKIFYLNDFYLLMPIAIFYIMLAIAINSLRLKSNHIVNIALPLLGLFIITLNIKNVFHLKSITKNEVSYYQSSYEKEGGCYNMNYYANILLKSRSFIELKKLAPIYMNETCYIATRNNWEYVVMLLSYMVILREDIPNNEKIEFFEKKPKTPTNLYAQASLLAKLNLIKTEELLDQLYNQLIKYNSEKEIQNMLMDGYNSVNILNYCSDKETDICLKFISLFKDLKIHKYPNTSEKLHELLLK